MLSLVSAPIGSEVTVAKISAENRIRRRLEDLGILAGQTIVPMMDSMGNIVVRVRDSRLVLNHGLAARIYVRS
jgi:ferrous iron transport protein A